MRPGLARRTGLLVTGMLATGAIRLAAQQPARPDSLADTSRVVELAPLIVTVTRTEEPLDRVPFAVDVAGARAVRGTRLTLGLDESLNDLPGVYVANRYNFSLDQRLSIRGFGSRSNFGVRGIKVLLDGVPQTLPDGQGQLTNVELGAVDRIEVLRGASSALYGNAAGGVVSLHSEPAAAAPYAQRLRVEGGDFDTFKWQSWSSARLGRLSGTLSLSRLTTDGFRQHSAADLRQLNAGADYLLSGTTTAGVRLALADDPKAQNPGALSPEQYAVSRRSAAASSIANDADKAVTQQQLAVFVRHQTSSGAEYQATVFGFHRDLDNPIATGTYITIGRHVAGLRLNGTQPLGSAGAPKVTAGLDLQWQRDDRANYVSAAGRRTDTLQLNQRETVAEVGPFVQVHWSPLAPLLVSAGARYDDVTFDVDDHLASDGDQSGRRSMHSWSGNVGASWSFGDGLVPYVNVATSFETPTTTELVNRPDAIGGLNPELGPQRAVNYEAGARGRVGGRLRWSAAAFVANISDAIVQFEEVDGRAFFRNAGRTRNAGVELGVDASPIQGFSAFASYTYADYRFDRYRVVNGATTDTLDGNVLPGVPRHFARIGIRVQPGGGLTIAADQTLSSSLWTDDDNTLAVAGWGAGVTDLRLGWDGAVGDLAFAPFIGIDNLFDRRYVGSVSINGFGGRVLEPSPGRNLYVGAEVGWRTRPAD